MTQHYDAGGELFKQHRYEDALGAYSKGLLFSGQEDPSGTLTLKLQLNISLCALKLRLYELAVEACTEALESDPKNVKALMRRAAAREYMGDFQRSIDDLQAILSNSCPASLLSTVAESHRRLSSLLGWYSLSFGLYYAKF